MNIIFNGNEVFEKEGITLLEFKQKYFENADVIILNGFQTNENRVLKNNDVITMLKKGVMPSKDVLEYMMMSRHTPFVHEKVKKANVAICGLGGLGSNIAVMLARTGVGKLLLIDFDVVEPSNLNRQNYYIKHLGLYKTEALKMQINDINPYIDVEIKNIYIDKNNIVELLKDYDIICDAFDNPVCKAELVNTVMEYMPNKKIVASSGMAGYESSNIIKTIKKFKNLYICGDGVYEAEEGRGLMAPRVNICASHQANMVLRLILGIYEV